MINVNEIKDYLTLCLLSVKKNCKKLQKNLFMSNILFYICNALRVSAIDPSLL